MNAPMPAQPTPAQRWQAYARSAEHGFHVYASWLVSITWKRFAILSVLLVIGANILQELPPFSFTWRVAEEREVSTPPKSRPAKSTRKEKPAPAEKAAEPAAPATEASGAGHDDDGLRYEIQIDGRGVRIVPRHPQAASEAASDVDPNLPSVDIRIPSERQREAVREAVEDAKRALEEAAEEARNAQADAEEARRELEQAKADVEDGVRKIRYRTVRLGEFLDKLALLVILASVLIKATYKGRIQAEVKAAKATETAEAESLRRQVVEARMAAMQAQVEPHFLFNTLASIDHLIETDPPRASQMQRNLIALLRASMPTMREANANGGVRDLGREMAVIRPYLDILQMRMEERLQTQIEVPDGLLSAEFPPMMIQGLVENAIKHGLEPKAEGGSLRLKAEVVHGKLTVTVADTGLGFGRAATAGTGVGLANIRERLSLLYGKTASVTVSENQPSGTVVTITVPYRTASSATANADTTSTSSAHDQGAHA
ncbi:sensor histidine kinase [Roseateles amylovorans]|uniref:histidine kinase n=1 Tax=Roseateles amylovorans TaxID=2978473 RepID=A0ABY6B0Y6_9BURK|nr:histidine kinase [Roseateles amylovorans]UXH78847.1 histidine kinase [Roseateles amylovorans]